MQLQRAEARLIHGIEERFEGGGLHARDIATLGALVGAGRRHREGNQDLAAQLARRVGGGVDLHVGAGEERLEEAVPVAGDRAEEVRLGQDAIDADLVSRGIARAEEEGRNSAVFVGTAEMNVDLGDAGYARGEVDPDLAATLLALRHERAAANAGDGRHDLVSAELGLVEDGATERSLGPEWRRSEGGGANQEDERERDEAEAGPSQLREPGHGTSPVWAFFVRACGSM